MSCDCVPLCSPKMSDRKPRMPNITRKYHDTDETYDTSSVLQ